MKEAAADLRVCDVVRDATTRCLVLFEVLFVGKLVDGNNGKKRKLVCRCFSKVQTTTRKTATRCGTE